MMTLSACRRDVATPLHLCRIHFEQLDAHRGPIVLVETNWNSIFLDTEHSQNMPKTRESNTSLTTVYSPRS